MPSWLADSAPPLALRAGAVSAGSRGTSSERHRVGVEGEFGGPCRNPGEAPGREEHPRRGGAARRPADSGGGIRTVDVDDAHICPEGPVSREACPPSLPRPEAAQRAASVSSAALKPAAAGRRGQPNVPAHWHVSRETDPDPTHESRKMAPITFPHPKAPSVGRVSNTVDGSAHTPGSTAAGRKFLGIEVPRRAPDATLEATVLASAPPAPPRSSPACFT